MIARTCIGELLLEVIQGKKLSIHRQHPWLTPEHIALFYAQSMSFVVIQWIKSGMEVEPREITDIYNYMITRSMSQAMEEL